uniref:hypothetical protein n=1 Tax=Streptomyces flavofungini TaxID=68200 RepID=UPI0034DFD15F
MTPAQLLDKASIIAELRRLAALPELSPRAAELDALHKDLGSMTRLDQWAEIDLVQAYVRPESVTSPSEQTSGKHDRLLEAALGVLVFVPLLITWFGLREAVRAYGELAKEEPRQATRPFLQLWQSGFGGHLSSFGRFENVALMAVLLIALLVLLSVWHARVRVRADRDESAQEAARERVCGELASVLTRTQLLLAPHRSASPQQFGAELTKAAKEMGDLVAKAAQNHQALGGATAAVGRATDALKSAALALSTEIPKLGSVADRIDTTLHNGTAETAKAGRANAVAAGKIAGQVKAAGDTVEASLKTLVAAQQSLVARSESVVKATEQASQALVASTGRTSDAVDGMREATERWDAAAAHWQDAAARLDARMDSLAVAMSLPTTTYTANGTTQASGPPPGTNGTHVAGAPGTGRVTSPGYAPDAGHAGTSGYAPGAGGSTGYASDVGEGATGYASGAGGTSSGYAPDAGHRGTSGYAPDAGHRVTSGYAPDAGGTSANHSPGAGRAATGRSADAGHGATTGYSPGAGGAPTSNSPDTGGTSSGYSPGTGPDRRYSPDSSTSPSATRRTTGDGTRTPGSAYAPRDGHSPGTAYSPDEAATPGTAYSPSDAGPSRTAYSPRDATTPGTPCPPADAAVTPNAPRI